MAEEEQAGHADDDVQAQPEHHVQQERDEDVGLVGGHEPGDGAENGQQDNLDRQSQGGVLQHGGEPPGLLAAGRGHGVPGFLAAQRPAPDEGQHEAADADQGQVFPAPDHGLLDGVDPDDHDREGQKHEPDADLNGFDEFVHYRLRPSRECRQPIIPFPPWPCPGCPKAGRSGRPPAG